MSDAQARELFDRVIAWTTPRVTKELRPLGLAVGPFTYRYTDLNKGQHSRRPAHLLKCAQVSFRQRDRYGVPGNVLEVDLVAIAETAAWMGIPVADLMVKLAAHEETHIAHNQDESMAEARTKLDEDFRNTKREMTAVGPEKGGVWTPELESLQRKLFLKTLKLHSAVLGQPYLREGLAIDTEIKVSSDGRRPANETHKYVDGEVIVSTLLENPKLGPEVVRELMETTGPTVDYMFTPYEAEFDPDRWFRRIRRVGLPMSLPEHTFEQRFAAKYVRNPGETIGRLLEEHAKTGVTLAVTQAGDSDQLPTPLAHLAWDIGHVMAEVQGGNPRETQLAAIRVFREEDVDTRIVKFEKLVSAAATVAAHRAETAYAAGNPMPATIGNLSRSVSKLMEVERAPRPTLARAAARALFRR